MKPARCICGGRGAHAGSVSCSSVAVAALVVGLGGLAAPRAPAPRRGTPARPEPGNTNTFNLSAQANALDVLITDPSLPLSGDLDYEVGPWGASASVDSLGESISDAGAPYPPRSTHSPERSTGWRPATSRLCPHCPGYVSASYPSTPTNTQSQAGYDIVVHAGAMTAKGAVESRRAAERLAQLDVLRFRADHGEQRRQRER